MNKSKLNRILRDSEYVIKMMTETLFGHRVMTYSQKDTDKLHKKIRVPSTDKEREEYVDKVEPLMNKKQFVPTGKEPSLDRYLDIDTYVSRADYTSSSEEEMEDDDIETQFNDIDITNLK